MLTDEKKKARYDAGHDDLDGEDMFGGGGGMGGINPMDLFAQMFGGGMGGMGGGKL